MKKKTKENIDYILNLLANIIGAALGLWATYYAIRIFSNLAKEHVIWN